MVQKQIFMAFFRTGMLGYGGGPSSIPLVHKEVVSKYKWMSDDEFSDILAMGNTLPGPIATKMAGYIGYRVGGYVGMINAVLASIVPTIILMIALLTIMSNFSDKSWVQGMTLAVLPVVGVMLAEMTWDFFSRSKKTLGWIKASICIVISFVLMEIIGINAGIVVTGFLMLPFLTLLKRGRSKE